MRMTDRSRRTSTQLRKRSQALGVHFTPARGATPSPAGLTFTLHRTAVGDVTGASSRRREDKTPASRRSTAPTRSASKTRRSKLATASAARNGKGWLTTCTKISHKAKPRRHLDGCQGGRQGSSHLPTSYAGEQRKTPRDGSARELPLLPSVIATVRYVRLQCPPLVSQS